VEEKENMRPRLPEEEFVAVLPGSAWRGKEWPYFPELSQLIGRKVPVVVLGAEKDLVCDEIARRSNHPASRSLRGQTSLRESMAVIAQARWVVGNDTGMVHVAEALGKDVAMIEGPTHEWMGFSPYREGSAVLGLPLICRPCSKSGRVCVRFGTRKCLNDLTVAEVAARLRQRGFPC
jgi:ADP-heptose:LPS heptosyltransferase